MNKLLIAMCVTALSGAVTPVFAETVTVVRGIMVSNESWTLDAPEAGIYDIYVTPDGAVKQVALDSEMTGVVSALVKDNVLYTVNVNVAAGTYFIQKYSTDDWSKTGSKVSISGYNAPAGLTYDPVTDKAYGSFWSDSYDGYSLFGTFNLSSGSTSMIDKVQRDERDIFALAADGKGKIYSLFGSYNYLATLDPTDGQVNRIKTTGLEPICNMAKGYVSSMCYDDTDNMLIATVAEEEGWGANAKVHSSLCVIDPESGAVNKIMEFPGNACFAGLHVVRHEETIPSSASGVISEHPESRRIFNLQGVEVSNPDHGVFIELKDGTISKILR